MFRRGGALRSFATPKHGNAVARCRRDNSWNVAQLPLRLYNRGRLKRTFTAFGLGILNGEGERYGDYGILPRPGSRFAHGQEQRRKDAAHEHSYYGDSAYHIGRSATAP